MVLPGYVMECVDALEGAGFAVWAVGGCVRDSVLGIEPHDFDLCTAALPEEMQAVFSRRQLVLAGLKHGTVGVVTEGGVVEITTFRSEGDYSDRRHPGWVRFVPTVEEDLARRDFTVNAMAYSPKRGFADPFGGREDLKHGILRAVGDPELRFREDALRILRGLRFAARFGLEIEENTWNAMLSQQSGLDNLARERVFDELCKLMCVVDSDRLKKYVPILAQVIPELGKCVGFDQRNPHHAHDVFTHISKVVGGVPADPALRMAALLHDAAKPACFTQDETGRGHFYGHAQVGAELADIILRRLKAPNAFREEVVWLVGNHMLKTMTEPRSVRRALSRYGLERMEKLLKLQRADLMGKDAEPVERELAILEELSHALRSMAESEGQMNLRRLAVSGKDLMALGYTPGPDLGKTLDRLLQMVIAEEAENQKEALLNLAREWLGQQGREPA